VSGDSPGGRLAVRLAANSLVWAAGSALSALVAFLTFVAVTRGLGPDAYGHITAALAFLFIPAVLAEAGLSAAVLRQISAAPEETEHAMRASLPLRTLVSVAAIGAAIGIGFAMPFPHLTKVAILISSLGSLFTLMTVNVVPVLQAQLKMQWAAVATLAGRIATLGLTLGALGVGLGFKAVLFAQVAGLGLTLLLHLVVVGRIVSLRPLLDVPYWRRLALGSLVLGMAIALGQVYFRVDALLLALIRSPFEVGLYGAAYKFIELSELVVVALALTVFPPLARFVAVGDARARELVQKAFDVMLAAAAPLAVLMVVFAGPIMLVSAGPEFREGADALRLLGPYVLFSFVNGLFFRVLMAFGRDRLLLGLTSSFLTANVVLNLIFLPMYGFRAAAVITVATEALALVAYSVAVRRRGLAPQVGYAPIVAAAAGTMALVGFATPGPSGIAAAAACIAYALVLLTLPGTAREVVTGTLIPATRRLGRRPG
jgi:O-antigen/teichoic acid export membrane protein